MDADHLADDRMLDRQSRRTEPSAWTFSGRWGVVSSAHYRATGAGASILQQGGNAFDAAVATCLALGVVETAASGLGGMAMAVVHLAAGERTLTLESPCRAPAGARPELYRDAGKPRRGYRAVAVPSAPALLAHVMERWGTLPLEALMAPAIEMAGGGYRVTPQESRLAQEYIRPLSRNSGGAVVLDPDGRPPAPGSTRRQPALARTLSRLARAGLQDFYTGEVARTIVRDMEASGGLVRAGDLAGMPRPREGEPLHGTFGGMHVHAPGPPGGGVTIIEMLQVVDRLMPADLDPDSPEAAVLLASVIRRARFDRRLFPDGIPGAGDRRGPPLWSRAWSRAAALAVSCEILQAGRRAPPPRRTSRDDGEGETSHVCVMDRLGNVVSLTQSIERSFGAAVAAPALGFLYNGYMRTFKVHRTGHPHYMRPGAPARSNATPTLLLGPDGRRIAIGSTGSERMASGILQVLVRLRSQDPFTAVASPRLHASPDGDVLLEAGRFPESVHAALRARGFTLEAWDDWSFKTGGLNLALCDGTLFHGVGEPRRDAAAHGPAVEPPSRASEPRVPLAGCKAEPRG